MQKIQWNRVTWYSKLLALILFVVVFFLGFHFGKEWGEATQSMRDSAIMLNR